jgi:dihydrofolate reductase
MKKLPFEVNHYVYIVPNNKAKAIGQHTANLYPWNDGHSYKTFHRTVRDGILVMSAELGRQLTRPIADVVNVIVEDDVVHRPNSRISPHRRHGFHYLRQSDLPNLMKILPSSWVDKTVWIVGGEQLLKDTYQEAKRHLVLMSEDSYRKSHTHMLYDFECLNRCGKSNRLQVGKHISAKLFSLTAYTKPWWFKLFFKRIIDRNRRVETLALLNQTVLK